MSASPSHRRRDSLDDPDSLAAPSSSAAHLSHAAPAPSSDPAAADDDAQEAAELAAMKARVAEMEAEAQKLRELTAASEVISTSGGQGGEGDTAMSDEDREAVDSRSIYVGNVDYASTPEEIQQHFASCGTINRVTILFDKYTGPKGYAYVEFADPSLVQNAVLLNETMFRGRLLKVSPKRTNVPGFNGGGGGGRGGRGRGRGGYRGGYRGYGGYSPYPRGGRGRGRGRGGYQAQA
ncbi:hypothetical protein JCM8547_000710 [Rhodosporidiobolus lusitaniae]